MRASSEVAADAGGGSKAEELLSLEMETLLSGAEGPVAAKQMLPESVPLASIGVLSSGCGVLLDGGCGSGHGGCSWSAPTVGPCVALVAAFGGVVVLFQRSVPAAPPLACGRRSWADLVFFPPFLGIDRSGGLG